MEKALIFCFVLFSFFSCKTSWLEGEYPPCIKAKIEDFMGKSNSSSVQWRNFDGGRVYKFSTTSEDFYLHERCDTVCQYAYISSFLPPCKMDMDNAANWRIIWEK